MTQMKLIFADKKSVEISPIIGFVTLSRAEMCVLLNADDADETDTRR